MYTGLWDSLVEALLTTSTRQSRGMSWAVVAKARTPGIERELQMHVTWLLGEDAGALEAPRESWAWHPPVCFWMLPREALKWVSNHFPSEEIIPLGGSSKTSSRKWASPTQSQGAVASSAGGFEARTLGRRWVRQSPVGFLSWVFQGIVPQVYELKVEGAPCGVKETPFLPQREAPVSGSLLTVGRCAAWVGFVARSALLLLQLWCEPSLAWWNNRSCLDRFLPSPPALHPPYSSTRRAWFFHL